VPVDRVALVTGGGTGIGRATALALAGDGVAVVVAGRRREPLREVVAEIEAAGGEAAAAAGDLAVPEHADAAVRVATQRFGALHVVVNNAGVIRRNTRLHEVGIEQWDEQIALNLRGPYLVLRAALPALLAADGDRAIVNVSSTLAVKAFPGVGPYAAAKGALISLTRSLAVEYGPDGIRSNVVLPAIVRTALAHTDRPDLEAREDDYAAAYPLGRLGEPEDVAEAIRYLASPAAGWVSGTVINVDGGLTAA
jgi:NAD(P)-dependent dehydrogenase (short-subunit alcohol dehydrogenase family)